MVGSFSCENVFRNANSLSVAAASGGGGTRKSLPEEIAQVFQEPAFGSICPTPSWARALKTSMRTRNVCSVISLFIAVLLHIAAATIAAAKTKVRVLHLSGPRGFHKT